MADTLPHLLAGELMLDEGVADTEDPIEEDEDQKSRNCNLRGKAIANGGDECFE